MQRLSASLVHCTVSDGLARLTVLVGSAARQARPGHFVVIDLLESPAQAFLLRSAFVAAADVEQQTIELWCAESELAREWPLRYPGLELTLYGFFGTPLSAPRSAALLLAGYGPALPALFFLAARQSTSCSIVVAPIGDGMQPPVQRLPADVEVLSGITALNAPALQSALRWADQVVFALPFDQHPAAAEAVRSVRLRWDAGFAALLCDPQARCVTGVCRSCRVMTRRGVRLLCRQGPLFDLRDL